MPPIIRTEGLRKVYRVGHEKVVALDNVNIAIEPGEMCCIVGTSGSGKSTLLNQLAGLEKPTRGQVYIGKHEISAMSESELAKFRQAHLGFIFQDVYKRQGSVRPRRSFPAPSGSWAPAGRSGRSDPRCPPAGNPRPDVRSSTRNPSGGWRRSPQ